MKPQETHKQDSIEYTHPAFGIINLSRVHRAGEKNLFGSEIKHRNTIELTISTGYSTRNLNRHWHRPKSRLIQVEMSEAQFGQMISSFNQGEGTPVTLNYVRGEEDIPNIELESLHQVFNKEMKESVRKNIEKVTQAVKDLRKVLDEGKLGKKTLDPLVHTLECYMANMPANLAFVDTSFQESMERATQAAKAEIEAFAQARERSQFQLTEEKDAK